MSIYLVHSKKFDRNQFRVLLTDYFYCIDVAPILAAIV